MKTTVFGGVLGEMIKRAKCGSCSDVDFIMGHLTKDASLSLTRNVDFSLSLISSDPGVERMKFYLFSGSQIQRNYASLYFSRKGEWNYVNEAYQMGLIDKLQAYSR